MLRSQKGGIMGQSVIAISRYALPALALIIIICCFVALFRRRPPNLGHAKLVDPVSGKYYLLVNRETSIGRNKNSDILLEDPTVSRLHAVIVCSKKGWYITNIRSEAGVIINGQKAEKKAFLKSGDTIRLGGVHLIFDNTQG